MKPNTIFVGVDAADFDTLSAWWRKLLGREWDRTPMPSCREWDLTDDVLMQVRDNPAQKGAGRVTMRVADMEAEIARLRGAGITVPDPTRVDGFASLRYSEFTDPEGNTVGLLDGE